MLVFQSYRIRFLVCVAITVIAYTFGDSKPWRGIVPLRSTRVDVERLLGAPSMDHGDTVVYETGDERVSIEYSKGGCTVPLMHKSKPPRRVG